MEFTSNTLKLFAGRKEIINQGKIIYAFRDDIIDHSVYYIVAGMVKLEYNLPGEKQLKLYLQPGTIFGLEESIEAHMRLSTALAMEKTMLYKWDLESFFENADESSELATLTIKSLSHFIRILNAEYGEQLIENRNYVQATSEENKLDILELNPENLFAAKTNGHLRHTFRDKQILIKEGEIQKQIYWILSGEVFVTKYINLKHKILAKLGKGELIGEMSFFDRSLTSATVIANGDVQVMSFSKKDFKEIFFANSKWVKRLLFSLSERILSMVKKLYSLSRELAGKK